MVVNINFHAKVSDGAWLELQTDAMEMKEPFDRVPLGVAERGVLTQLKQMPESTNQIIDTSMKNEQLLLGNRALNVRAV